MLARLKLLLAEINVKFAKRINKTVCFTKPNAAPFIEWICDFAIYKIFVKNFDCALVNVRAIKRTGH